MNGLLGNSWDDPRTMATLALAQGLLGGGGSMQRLAGGLAGYQGTMARSKREEEDKQRRALQDQMARLQLQTVMGQQAQAKAAAERQAKDEGLIRNLVTGTPADGMGPPSMRPQMDPQAFLAGGGSMQGLPALVQLNQMLAPKPADYKVVGGSLVKVGPEGVSEAYRAPQESKPTAGIQEYEYAKAQGYRGTFEQFKRTMAQASASQQINYGSPVAGIGPDGKPVFFQPSKTGGEPAIIQNVRPVADAEKPLTEGQAKAVSFASRMKSADQTLAKLARSGVRVTVPGAMDNNAVGSAITAVMGPEQQQLAQAKRDFVNAVLRRESGAVISADEFANAERQYFPQIGESRQVIEQKAQNRRIAIEGMAADIPRGRRSEVDAIVNGSVDDSDPLNLRGK